MRPITRRRFLGIVAGTACLSAENAPASEQARAYTRANTDWLAKCRYGIGVHWTAQTVPRKGRPLPFQKAVDAFDVKRFVERLDVPGGPGLGASPVGHGGSEAALL